MNAAVTGGSGFFGGALVRALVQRGDTVRALARRDEAADMLKSWGAEPFRGDLTDAGSLAGFVQPGDVVYHSAARVDMSGRWVKFQRTTIEGTRDLLAAALPHKPRRFVYISSGGVYPMTGKRDGPIRADRTPARPPHFNFYGRAKLAAENLVRTECTRAGCDWTILRMGFLYGAGNQALFNHFVPLASAGRMYIIGKGDNRIAVLYIDDSVRAAIASGEHPAAVGKIYDVAGDDVVTQKEFVLATCESLGLPPAAKRTMRGAAMFVAWITDWLSNIYDHESHISRAAVGLMSADQNVDSTPIRADLGWRPEIDFAEGTRRTRQWCENLKRESGAAGDSLDMKAAETT